MTSTGSKDLREAAIDQWEVQREVNYTSTVEDMINEMNATFDKLAKHFKKDIEKINNDGEFSDYLRGTMDDALFELVKFDTGMGKKINRERQNRKVQALLELNTLEKSIKGFIDNSLDGVNKLVGSRRKIKFPKKLILSLEKASLHLERGFSETRGRPPKSKSILVRAIFEALEDGLERDLTRSYRTDVEPKDEKLPTSFQHADVEIVFRISKRVFPDLTCPEVTSALKALKSRRRKKREK